MFTEHTLSGTIASKTDESVLRATKMLNNTQYYYHKTDYYPHTAMADALGNATLMDFYYTLTEDIINWKSTDFYEIILFDTLIENFENEELQINIAESTEKSAITSFIDVCNEIYGEAFVDNYYMTAEFLNGTIDEETLIKITQISGMSDVLSIFKTGKNIYKTYGELLNAFRYVYMLNSVGDLQIQVLEQVKRNTTNTELSDAARALIISIKTAKTNPDITLGLELTKFTARVAVDALRDVVDNTLISQNPYLLLLKFAYKGGKFVADNIYNASSLSYDALCLIAINETDKAMRTSLDSLEKRFQNNPTKENAELLIATADAYKKLIRYGNGVCVRYVEGAKQEEVKADVFSTYVSSLAVNPVAVFQILEKFLDNTSSDYDDLIASLQNIDRMVKDSNWYE